MRITTNTHFKAFKPKVHGPDQYSPQAFGTLEMDADTGIDYASIYVHSEAEADALIKAACALKDMLHARNHEAAMTDPLPDRGRYDAKSVAEVDEGVAPAGDLYRTATAADPTGSAAGQAATTTGAAATASGPAGEPVKLCRCDRYPSSHVPWDGCPEWAEVMAQDVNTGLHTDALAAEQLAADVARKEGRG